jgi:hypothetical protein
MRALKAVVWSLGALCVAAFCVLIYLVVARVGAKNASEMPTQTAAPPLAGLRWNDVSLGQPAGARIVAIVPVGGFLAVQIERPGGIGAIVIVDPASGQIRGRIETGASAQ